MEIDSELLIKNLASMVKEDAIHFFIRLFSIRNKGGEVIKYPNHENWEKGGEKILEDSFREMVEKRSKSTVEFLRGWMNRSLDSMGDYYETDYEDESMYDDPAEYHMRTSHHLYLLYKTILNFEAIADHSGQTIHNLAPHNLLTSIILSYRYIMHMEGFSEGPLVQSIIKKFASTRGGSHGKELKGWLMAIQKYYTEKPGKTIRDAIRHFGKFDKGNPYRIDEYLLYTEYDEAKHEYLLFQVDPDGKVRSRKESVLARYSAKVSPKRLRRKSDN